MEGFDLWEVLGNADYAAMLREGIRFTFIVFACSWLLAMSLGILLLTIRQLPGRLPTGVVTAYISYHRNVPTLVQLMLWYFGISALLPTALQYWLTDHNGETIFAIIALGLCQAAYFSEDLRSGLRSIPTGQAEAAKALGHGHVSSMRYVMMPQAVRNALPALINHTVLALQELQPCNGYRCLRAHPCGAGGPEHELPGVRGLHDRDCALSRLLAPS